MRRSTSCSIAWAMAGAVTLVLAGLGLARYEALQCRAHDLGNLAQALFNTWHGAPFRCTINLDLGLPPSYLGNHFSLGLAVLAPLVGPWGDPRPLIVVQALAVGLSLPLVWALAARHLSPGTALWVTGLLALQPTLWMAGTFDVHQELLVLPLLCAAILEADRGHIARAIALTGLASTVFESVPLVAGTWWLVVALGSGHRLAALTAGVAHLALFLLAMQVVIPWFAGGVAHPYIAWRYGHLGSSLGDVVLTMVTRPHVVLGHLAGPANAQAILGLVASMGFLPLLGLEVCLAPAPYLAAVALSRIQPLDLAYNHPSLALPYIGAATVLGLTRARTRLPWLMDGDSVRARPAAVVLAGALILHALCHSAIKPQTYSPLSPLAQWSDYRPSSVRDDVGSLAALVPAGAPISVQQNLVAPLSCRRDIYVFPYGTDRVGHVLLHLDHPTPGRTGAPRDLLLYGLWAPRGLHTWVEEVGRLLGDPAWGVAGVRGRAVLLSRGAPRTGSETVRGILDDARRRWEALE